MKLSYSQKIFIISLTGFIIVLVSNIFFVNLLIGKIIGINDKIKQINISSVEREKALTLRDLATDSKTQREELEQYFIGTGNVATINFTKYLEDLAMEMGVAQKKSLADELVVGLESSGLVSAIRYRFNVSGQWENVYNFLLAIENLPKVLLLNSVSFNISSNVVSPLTKKSVDKIWSVDLDFSVAKLNN